MTEFILKIPIYDHLSLAVLFYLIIMMLATLWVWGIYRRLQTVHKTRWWDLSRKGPYVKLDWPNVKRLMNDDPITFESTCRSGGFGNAIMSVAILFFGGSLLINFIFLVHRYVDSVSSENLAEIATFAGGISVALGVITLLVQTRVATRSKNRQAWIDRIRDVLAELISNIPEVHSGSSQKTGAGKLSDVQKMEIEGAQNFYMEVHAELELFLNPSEKEHRALLSLLRYMYRWDKIDIDDEPFNELNIGSLNRDETTDWIKLKSQVIRLSNVVLKREWEQVKNIT